MSNNEWIGVDLDGTLAYYDRWRGATHIGKPIPAMVKRVQRLLEQGRIVKIFTARAYNATSETIELIQDWSEEHVGRRLEVTCAKDPELVEIYDDCARQVMINTGRIVTIKNKMKDM